jgi:hypothetical protein
MKQLIDIQLLFAPGCKSQDATIAMTEKAVQAIPNHRIRITMVSSAEEVRSAGFLGSPSIRINGVDIEPGAEKRRDFSLA